MVILATKEGQLANRIYHASNFIVNAQENHYRICHLFFGEYYSFFSESLAQRRSPIRFLGKRNGHFLSLLRSAIIFIIRALLKLRIKKLPFIEIIDYRTYERDISVFDLNDPQFIKKARSKLVFVLGWLFRDPKNYIKYKQLLIDVWRPNKKFLDKITAYNERYRKGNDILIGIHIRGGDYKNWEGGKWYYDPAEYYKKMKEVAGLKMFAGKRIAYVICTNEKNISFPGEGNFAIFDEERHFIEDLYLLAKCDYIIGPPSTFSGWASIYGNVPLYMLKEITIQLSDETFTSKIISF